MARELASVGAAVVAESLEELGRIGGDASGGVTRVAWSRELFAAYEWVAQRMRELGLATEVDAAGNLFGRWHAGTGPPLLVGSHLDTVPRGGRYDGALGVVAAIHAVAELQADGFEPPRPIWIVAFMDEEGTRFDAALFGSRAFCGEDVSRLAGRRDAQGVSLRDAMAERGREIDRVTDAARVRDVGAYLELHVEQGPVLDTAGLEIGVVTSIVGLRGYRVRLHGQANHAGTTPMPLRRDALVGAARVAVELRDAARAREHVTVNVGKMTVRPGGANVVPGLVEFTVDIRGITQGVMPELERLVESTVARVAAEEALEPEMEPTFALDPLELDPALVDLVERAAGDVGAAATRMPSGAGHDAMIVGRHVPAAMLFVPSRNGISHSPDEFTAPEHVELGTRALAAAIRRASEDGIGDPCA